MLYHRVQQTDMKLNYRTGNPTWWHDCPQVDHIHMNVPNISPYIAVTTLYAVWNRADNGCLRVRALRVFDPLIMLPGMLFPLLWRWLLPVPNSLITSSPIRICVDMSLKIWTCYHWTSGSMGISLQWVSRTTHTEKLLLFIKGTLLHTL